MKQIARKSTALLILAVVVSGCEARPRADYRSLGLADVGGVVRIDGRPLSNVQVIFENEDKTFSYAQTDAEGRYRLNFDSDQHGVPPGRKIVRIVGQFAADGEEPSGEERIPARYNTNSELTVEIMPDTRTMDFDLETST